LKVQYSQEARFTSYTIKEAGTGDNLNSHALLVEGRKGRWRRRNDVLV
jgi:hypothetical protein